MSNVQRQTSNESFDIGRSTFDLSGARRGDVLQLQNQNKAPRAS